MRCPACLYPKMLKSMGFEEIIYKGESYVVPDIKKSWCPGCGEEVYDEDSYPKITTAHAKIIENARAKEGDK